MTTIKPPKETDDIERWLEYWRQVRPEEAARTLPNDECLIDWWRQVFYAEYAEIEAMERGEDGRFGGDDY